MKILHVVPTYYPAIRYGGPIRSVHGLSKALAAKGHDVTVFTTNIDGPGVSDVPLDRPVLMDGVKVRYFHSIFLKRIYFSPPMSRALRAEICSYDLVHLHSVFLWPTSMAARLCRKNKISYVLSPRGMLVNRLIQKKSKW